MAPSPVRPTPHPGGTPRRARTPSGRTCRAGIFIFEDTRQVKIRLLIPEVSMPPCLALGAVIGVICGGYFIRFIRGRR
ncbi:DUF1049 domain-containing protein [Streptomyces aureus]|uniref:DUF1049 domain-containing protein n=1 Tax=Streptomyces aureus TaxID=193461 RepID=A0ABV4SF83_9ACTN